MISKKVVRKLKLIPFLSVFLFGISGFALSCGQNNSDTLITLATNNSPLQDSGINQQSDIGAEDFIDEQKGFDAIPKYFLNYTQPETNTTQAYQDSYNNALEMNPSAFIATGSEQSKIGQIESFANSHKNKKVLLVGATTKGTDNLHWIAPNYLQAGFLSGLYAGLYLNNLSLTTSNINVATFGRDISYESILTMDGFRQGVNYFNTQVLPNEPTFKSLVIHYANNSEPSTSDFVADYSSNSKEKSKVDQLVDDLVNNQGVQAFFPINYIQANYTIEHLAQNGQTSADHFVLGNYEDLSTSTSSNVYSQYVIGSNMINLKLLVQKALATLFNLSNNLILDQIYGYDNQNSYISFVQGKDHTSINVLDSLNWTGALKSEMFNDINLQTGNDSFGKLLEGTI